MASTEQQTLHLWEVAVHSALGPLSAYITPETYGLSTFNLAAVAREPDEFRAEIASRLDLARAAKVVELVQSVRGELPHTYRHAVHYCEDRIDGALLMGRLTRERAAGRKSRIPVLRAFRFIDTPEALLVSEALRVSFRVCSAWRMRGGAEGSLAAELASNIAGMEAQQPWASLRLRPRGVLRTLALTVKSRTIAGWNQPGSAIARLADLIINGSEAVSAGAGPIAFLVSEDPRFEDRLFELICLGWLLGALKGWDGGGEIHPENISGSGPVFVGRRGSLELRLHYQAGYVSSLARYRWQHTSKALRAIPDFTLELEQPGRTLTIILDAKNRGLSSNSEIIYKLLGYRENLGMTPYVALGIAPALSGGPSFDKVCFEERTAGVLRVPLTRGDRLIRLAFRNALRRLEATAETVQNGI